jgi:hypothetical protein
MFTSLGRWQGVGVEPSPVKRVPKPRLADGNVSSTAQLQVIDKNGRPFPNIPVSMQWMDGGAAQTGDATTDVNGMAVVRGRVGLTGTLVVAFVHLPESADPVKASTHFDDPQALIVRSVSGVPGLPWGTIGLVVGGVVAGGFAAWLFLRKRAAPRSAGVPTLGGRYHVRKKKPVLHVPPHVTRGSQGMYQLLKQRGIPAPLRRRV